MTSPPRSTIAWLRTVAERLGDLRLEVVFLGGATMELFITDPGAGAPRPTKAEIRSSAPDLRDYLAEAISKLLGTEAFREALPGYLPGDSASQARLPLLLDRLAQIAGRDPASRQP